MSEPTPFEKIDALEAAIETATKELNAMFEELLSDPGTRTTTAAKKHLLTALHALEEQGGEG